MLKIWGRKTSSNVQKVLWCCGELGVPFERIDIGGEFGKNRERPYLDLNPNGVVPTIEDGDFVLWESNSIVRYLVNKYEGGKLVPRTPEARGDANRWMDWQLTTMNAAMVPVFFGMVRTPEERRDMAAIGKALKEAGAKWEIVERHLEGRDYLTGDSFGIGDIPLGIWAYRWFAMSIDRPSLPNVEAWYGRLRERPPYREHVMIPLG